MAPNRPRIRPEPRQPPRAPNASLFGRRSRGRPIGYDAFANETSITWPDGGSSGYIYDSANRLTSAGNSAASMGLVYDGLGRLTSLTRPGSSSALGYDNADRMVSLAHGFTTGPSVSFAFGYTPADQVRTATTSTAAYDWINPGVSTTNKTADGLNRDATFAAVGSPCGATGAGYDCNGNLAFDGTRSFTYDHENRLIGEAGPVTLALAYDPLGRLQQETVNGAITQFLYDGDALVAEYDGANNLLRRYVRIPT
jgi:YD repeat-containing protein